MGDSYSLENKQHITACKQYCLAPAHAGQHQATSPTRKPLAAMQRQQHDS
jgi:hypothetical protein